MAQILYWSVAHLKNILRLQHIKYKSIGLGYVVFIALLHGDMQQNSFFLSLSHKNMFIDFLDSSLEWHLEKKGLTALIFVFENMRYLWILYWEV